MTYETLVGRLERLRRLAEIVDADKYETALSDILEGLEPPQDTNCEVEARLLADLRQRISTQR